MFAGEIPFGHRFQCQAYSKCMRTFNITPVVNTYTTGAFTLSYFKCLACISNFWPVCFCVLCRFNWNDNMNLRFLILYRYMYVWPDFVRFHPWVYYCRNDCAALGEERHHIPAENFKLATRNYSELYTKIINFLNPKAVSFEIPPLFCTVSRTILYKYFIYSWPRLFTSLRVPIFVVN